MANETGGANGTGTRRKARAKKGAKDGDEQEKDRLDGRAGPRSENVVLSKSVYFPIRFAGLNGLVLPPFSSLVDHEEAICSKCNRFLFFFI
jgi:hypothetical protein